jgi:hypothetical protein
VNRTNRILPLLSLAALVAVELTSCNQATSTAAADPPVPLNEVDRMINDYETVVNEYVHVAKMHQSGDLSVTMKLIADEELTQQTAAKLQQQSAKMTPAQTHRMARISARTAPYLK